MGRDYGVDDTRGKRIRVAKEKPKDQPRKQEPGLLTFPMDVFPGAIAAFGHAVAEAVRVPTDIPGPAMLTVLGSAIGATRKLRFREDWTAFPLLYTGTIAESGTGKSPALQHILRPIHDGQCQGFKKHERFKENIKRLAEKRAKEEESDAAKAQVKRKAIQKELLGRLKPVKRSIVQDATMEALVAIHVQNPRGLLMFQDELSAWIHSMDQYRGRGADRQRWLDNWNSGPIYVDRKTGGRDGGPQTLHIPRAHISVLGGIQPSMLAMLADRQGREDGFLPRILLSYPEDVRCDLPYSPTQVEDRHQQDWKQMVNQLMRLNFQSPDEPIPGVVEVSREAREAWIDWHDRCAFDMRHPDFDEVLRPVFCKARVYVQRIALILHCTRWQIEQPGDQWTLSPATMLDAIRVVDFFLSHAPRVYSSLHADRKDRQVEAILAWMERRQLKEVTARLVVQNGVAGVKGTKEARDLLSVLVDRGLALPREGDTGKPGYVKLVEDAHEDTDRQA